MNFLLLKKKKKKKSSVLRIHEKQYEIYIQQRYSTVVLPFQNLRKCLFVAEALNKKTKSCNMVPTNPHSLAEKYTCDSSSRTSMFSENECCYFTGVIMEEFPDDCNNVEYYKWAKLYGKVKKVVKSVKVEEAIELFNEQVKNLKAHIFVKRTQNTHYNLLKENLKQMNS